MCLSIWNWYLFILFLREDEKSITGLQTDILKAGIRIGLIKQFWVIFDSLGNLP